VVEDRVDVVFRLTRSEYVRGCRAVMLRRVYPSMVALLAIVSFVVAAIADAPFWLWLGVVCVVIVAVYIGLLPYWWWWRHADRGYDVRCSFGPDGVTLVREEQVTTGPWSEVRRVRQSGDLFVVEGQGPWFLIVPVRAFGSPEQLEFFTHLTAPVGP
jgi:hypothetical protein